MTIDLQDEILTRIAKGMQMEIDRDILWGVFKDQGWTRVTLSRLQDNNHAIDITHWLSLNCMGDFDRDGRFFIFENEKDAVNFILTWT